MILYIVLGQTAESNWTCVEFKGVTCGCCGYDKLVYINLDYNYDEFLKREDNL